MVTHTDTRRKGLGNLLLTMRFFSAALLAVTACGVMAQRLPIDANLPLEGVTRYRSEIPLPEQVIGHRIGTRHTRSDQIVDYYQAVAAASPRVTFDTHGRTHEGRQLIHSIVTSPENHRRLEAIREANKKLSTDPGSVSDAEIAKMPLIIWMGYNVHGNEASGSEAAILFLYHLAAGEGPAVDEVLKNFVIIMAPCYNPDGRDRFANWVNGNRGYNPTSDTDDLEHNEPWPGGRTNHYWFDLNRDWMPLTQPESIGRQEVWNAWHPQITTDYHEQGAAGNYFFQPGIQTRVNPNTPKQNQEITAKIARYHAQALEGVNQFYYTEERYDDFYIGKGSTYCDVRGSIGILFEQASTRSLITTVRERPFTFTTSVRNQVATCFSTMKACLAMREELLKNQRDFYRDAIAGKNIKWEGIALRRTDENQDRLAMLLRLMEKQNIQVMQSQGQPNTIWISLRQPESTLIQAMFDDRKEFDDNQFYDISSWALDYAFGLRGQRYPRGESPRTDWQPVDQALLNPQGSFAKLSRPEDAYAYVLEWTRWGAPKALHEIQEAGYEASLVMRPFPMPRLGRDIKPGAIVIQVSEDLDPADVEARLEQISRETKTDIYALGRTDGDIRSFGGSGASYLTQPRIALLAGSGTSSYNVGELWHCLDVGMDLKASLITPSSVSGDLSKYNTIVTAGSIPSSALENLRSWISSGGRLIAVGAGAEWAAGSLWELDSKRYRPNTTGLKYGEVGEEVGRHALPGAIFDAEFDTTHPLSFGIDERLPVFRDSTSFIVPPSAAGQTVARYTESPLLAGYSSPEVLQNAAGGAAFLARSQGRGSIILIADNPHFRAFFVGPDRMLANAIFFGGSF